MRPATAFLGLTAGVLLAASGHGGSVAPASAVASGRSGPELFAETCAYCHAEGGWGTRALAKRVPQGEAVLTERRNLPAAYVTYVVRHGVGSMPQLTPTDLTDEELARLARWLDEKN